MPIQHDLKSWTTDEMITAEHLNQSIQAVRDIETHLNEQATRFETKTLQATTMDISESATITSLNAGYLARAGLRVYDTGNKPTPADIGALPASGGTVSGSLNVTGALSRAGHTVYDTENKPTQTELGVPLKRVASIGISTSMVITLGNYLSFGEWGFLRLVATSGQDVFMRKDSGDFYSMYINDGSKSLATKSFSQRSGMVFAYRGLNNSSETNGLSLIGYNLENIVTGAMKWSIMGHSCLSSSTPYSSTSIQLSGHGVMEIYKPA